ncbi:MAG TPA: aldo/keto reductase [Planctomycetes bacterium]|nr:aldo/keto reductase [Planctomycetota bacterium]
MNYRPFGAKTDFSVSALGFGCMRLPVLGGDQAAVDEPEATRMLRRAIDQGVNYVDTAYVYHEGASERWLGRALAGGYRAKVRLATKLPVWSVATAKDFDRLLGEQLSRLATDRIDFYLLHCLHEGVWPKLKQLGVRDWLDAIVRDGRAGAVGFSFHDRLSVFEEIIEDYAGWTMCQIQYNYMNEDVQAGTEGLKYAAGRGLAVVIMEPLLGGALAAPPPAIRAILDGAGGGSPAELALRWLWDKPEPATVLSGMTAMAQVEENVAAASRAGAGALTAREREAIERARGAYRALDAVPCTRCYYCMPCRNGVDIPRNFQLYNDARHFGDAGRQLNRNLYAQLAAEKRASACIRCGECEERCPQRIAIGEEMDKVAQALG